MVENCKLQMAADETKSTNMTIIVNTQFSYNSNIFLTAFFNKQLKLCLQKTENR